MASSPEHVVELCRTATLIEANAIGEGLTAAGISVSLQGEDLQNTFGTIGWTFAPRVMVDAESAEKARGVLADIINSLEGSSSPSDDSVVKCLECGTEMRDAETCPKCGWTYADKSNV